MSTARAYCAVDGCLSKKRNKDLNFFKLPMDEKRRNEWLNIIGRPDLMNRPDLKPQSYVVCSIHFDDDMIIMKPQLKREAKPTKHIPDRPYQVVTVDACSQTEQSLVLKTKFKTKTRHNGAAASPMGHIKIVKVESQRSEAAVQAENERKRKIAQEEEERKRKATDAGGFVVEIYGRGARR